MRVEYIVLSIPLFFLLIGLELMWSAWSGSKVYRFSDAIANLGCGIGSQVVGAFTKTTIFGVYLWVYDNARVFTLPSTALTWVITFLLIDVLYYWFHRLSHEVNFLWAAHIVHHQSEEYNLSVALRQSWWQGLFSFWFYVPVALLGVHPLVIVTVGAFVTLYQFWIHTKAVGRMGPFEWLFNTPSHHRVHHGSDPKYIDRNHAGTLIIWDKLFGTYQREEEEPVYGITTPLRTWDPLQANFHYWLELAALARRCTSRWDKLRVYLKPPGWQPAYLGGFQGPRPKDKATYVKFETRVPLGVSAYVSVQFLALLFVTSAFLFLNAHLPTWSHWAIAAMILYWVMNLGLLLDGRTVAINLEALRILATTALCIAVAAVNWWNALISGVHWPSRMVVALIFVGAASMLHLITLLRTDPPAA